MTRTAAAVLRPVVVSLFLFLPALLIAQSITTYAGGGVEDGQLATDIPVFGARGVALDKSGNIYFTERFAGRVRRIDVATGRITTVAGIGASGFSGDGGRATSASLKGSRGLAVDAAGNVFVADHDNDRVRRIDAVTGIITTFAGGGQPEQGIGDGDVATKATFDGPWGLVISGGALFVTEDGYRGNRVRRIDLTTKIITTIAGGVDGVPGDTGDGANARDAKLNQPLGITADANGNLFVADSANSRIRRIEAGTNTITTYAGGGAPADGLGDGGVATNAKLVFPTVVAFDANGNLVIAAESRLRIVDKNTRVISTLINPETLIYGLAFDAAGNGYFEDESYNVVRRLDVTTHEVTTVAGGGSYIGDGLLATGAILHEPLGLAVNKAGDLFIADASNNVIRRVDATTQIVTTVAGRVGSYYAEEQEGHDAVGATIGGPLDVAIDSAGNLYIGDPHNSRIWRVDAAGKIATYASGDDLKYPAGLFFDSADNLYVADSEAHRIRRIDAKTKAITTVAGNGTEGFSGDGGPALAASLNTPHGVAVNAAGDIFIADTNNFVVRKVDAVTHNISSWAGRGSPEDGVGDGGAPSAAFIAPTRLAFERSSGDLLVVDDYTHRVRRIAANGSKISTFAGSGPPGDFAGDNGPATDAKLNFGYDLGGLAVAQNGSVFIGDTDNNRVRAVFACGAIAAPALLSPSTDITTTSAPQLRWSEPSLAFRYDVLLDTVNPPVKVVAADVTESSFTPSNLEPSTKYYWRVIAKGDRFCTPVATTPSAIGTFTTAGKCAAGAFTATSPADNATNVASPVQLTWQPSAGAASYDVYFGTINPPPLVAQNLTATSYSATVANLVRYYWYVVAHATCDATETASTSLRTFTGAPGQTCPSNAGVVTLTSPTNGATSAALDVVFSWTASSQLDSFDLYLGEDPNPTLVAAGFAARTQSVRGLRPGTKYYWRVGAHGPCDPAGVTSSVFTFTTRSCEAPAATSIVFAPSTVSAGATYSIVWSPAPGSDADAAYVIERSRTASFGEVETQVVSSTAATFVAEATGAYYHRVRAVAGCDVTKLGTASDVRTVSVVNARANVVFAVQPSAVITSLGEKLEDRRTTFTLENLGASPLQVIVGRQELNGSAPFFSIVDPLGQDVAFVTLEPRTPKTFAIRYAGPRSDVAGSYQGVIFVASTGEGLAVTPYAFVNLKVGGGTSAAPRFTIDGVATEYASFVPFSGDDSTRAPLQIGVRNDGNTPMEVGFDIGPEVWLTTDATWNATPIPPQSTRIVNLLTRRNRAPNGSALPRYTYLTVRTKDGASSRLLVQDNDAFAVANGRASRLDVGVRSFIVPEAISRTSASGARLATRVRLSNVGSDAVQAELIFTPAGADGFDPALVRRATVVVPPNDVVTITDPLPQLFGVPAPASGQIEVRLPRERIGLVAISATTGIAGGSGFAVPVVNRGEGARLGGAHSLPAITKSSSVTTAVVLAETSGNDHAAGRIVITSAAGAKLGEKTFDVPRYGYVRYDDVVASAGAQSADNARISVTVESGAGTVAAMAIISSNNSDNGAAIVSRPLTDVTNAFARTMQRLRGSANSAFSVTTVVPVVPSSNYATAIGLTAATSEATNFTLTFRGATTLVKQVSVPAGTTKIYANVLTDLFALAPSVSGSVFVDAPSASRVQAVLQPIAAPSAAPSSFVPLPTTLSEALTSAGASARRPLFFDGLEQSLDRARGARWSLLLNEVGGSSGNIDVLLYEAANRSTPIAGGTITIAPFQQLQLDTIFSILGLDSAQRRKERTNVQVVVIARGGSAKVAATAVSVDNATGETKAFALAPVAGSATPSVSLVEPVLPRISIPGKRRTVGH